MLTGELRGKIDTVWNAFWSGGIANPLEVIEQITYLLFIRGLDDAQQREENKATTLGQPIARVIFPEGTDGIGKEGGLPYRDLRWSVFKDREAKEMFEIVSEHVFPFLRDMAEEGSSHAEHMKGARFTIPTPALLSKVVDLLNDIPMDDRDTKGDLYEYMLGKIASAGQNGQFRTPRHIIRLMVELMAPTPKDVICDPAAGTAGFLVTAGEYLREHHPGLFRDDKLRRHFHETMFSGFDFDSTMLRIGSMNLQLHGVEGANLTYRDSLAEQGSDDEGNYSLVLANPPFSGSLDRESISKRLRRTVKTGKTELLFVARILEMLRTGGRAAIIVPNGVLENDGGAYDAIRGALLRECSLDAVISLPHWTFKPYASVATSILLLRRGEPTKKVLFLRIENEGFSNSAGRRPVPGSELSWAKECVLAHRRGDFEEIAGKARSVSIDELREYAFDLAPGVYLSGYDYPPHLEAVSVADVFDVFPGTIPASTSSEGAYQFVTSGASFKSLSTYELEGPAIVIPTVSSTGHGHASIKNIHYVDGKFSAATITAVLRPKEPTRIYTRFAYYYLMSHKDQILVPQMRGAANMTLSLERLKRVRIPLVGDICEQAKAVERIESTARKIDGLSDELSRLRSELALQVEALRKVL